jgi:hypothetical protein
MALFVCVLHSVAVTFCDHSEENKVSMFTVTEFIEVHTELIRWKKYAGYIRHLGVFGQSQIRKAGKELVLSWDTNN